MKWYQALLLLVSFILFIWSWSMFGYIGLEGLLSFLLFMVSGGYIVTFFVVNWDLLTKK